MLFTAGVCAQSKRPEAYFDNENIADGEKPWQEKTVTLPAYPDLDKLQAFYAGPATTFEFSIDPSSLQVGEDGVVRYTLVIKSRSGALNISHEGLRCNTLERKLYALGHTNDKSWSPVSRPEWRKIQYTEVNRHYVALATEYFCQSGMLLSNDPKVLLQKLKANRNF